MNTLCAVAAIFAASFLAVAAQAQTPATPVRLGVLTDLSSLFTDSTGKGSIEGVRMAVEDFGPTLLGRPIEIVTADHQNKPDNAAQIARRWYESEGVEVVIDVPNSAAALAVQEIARRAKKIDLLSAGGTEELSGNACSPYGFQWAFDLYAQAKVIVSGLPRLTPDTWYLLAADYTFGRTIEDHLAEFIEGGNGKVLGKVLHPIGTNDFSSFLLQAQSSGAGTIVLANGGADIVNSVKQAAEFNIAGGGKRIAAASAFMNEVHAMGAQLAQGLILAEFFYWDQNDETRAWSKRFFERMHRMPNSFHPAAYSATLHWLKAVKAAGTLDADTVAAKMRATPVNDVFQHDGHIRPDGRMLHDMLLVQVKTPAESKNEWDLYKILRVVPGEQAIRPLSESTCPLDKQ